MDITEIPARITEMNAGEMTEASGDFEADTRQRDGSITAALSARAFLAKRQTQGLDGRALAADIRRFEEAFQRSLAGLGMDPALVFHFDPGLGRLVQKIQRQVSVIFQHRQQASLDLPPEGFLLAVLVGRVRQRCLVNNAQTLESLFGFGGDHGRTVVGENRTGQAAFQECLAKAVNQVLGGLAPIPLRMTGEAGVVVQNAQQLRLHPFSFGAEDLVRAFMEIQMPQRIHMRDLVAAHFAAFQPALGLLAARRQFSTRSQCAKPTVAFHVADNGGIRRHAAVVRIGYDDSTQIVDVKLIAPTLMRRVLRFEQSSQIAVHGWLLPGVRA